MPTTVHVFASIGRFHSFEDVRRYVDLTDSEDGDGLDCELILEVGLENYEPGCIEAVHQPSVEPLVDLLEGVSDGDQWRLEVDGAIEADAAVCVFEPNTVARPLGSSLRYCGAFEYDPLAG